MRSSATCPTKLCLFPVLAFAILLSGCGTSATSSSAIGTPGASHTAPSIAAGPTLGLAWNATDSSLRSIAGVPGSALIGASIVPTGKYTAGAASVRLQMALLEDASGRVWLQPLETNAAPQQLATGQPQGLRFSFAATADSAVAWAPGTGNVLALTALSTQPSVETVSVPTGLLSAAIADNGSLLAAVATGSGASLLLRSPGTALATAATLGKFGGMAFIGASSDALYADAASNTVYRLHGASSPRVIATEKDGVSAPVAIAASVDQHWAAVANSAGGSLLRIDLSSTQAAQRLTCACTPTQLSPLSGNGVFQMTDAHTAAPVWAIDVASATPRTFFVPAQQAPAGGR